MAPATPAPMQLGLLDQEDEIKVERPDDARARLWRGRRAQSQPVSDRSLQRLFGIELLLILGLFPLGSILLAIKALVEHIETNTDAVNEVLPAISQKWLAFGMEALSHVTYFCVAGLVIYLLIRGKEGVGAINLGGGRLRMDLALVFPVFVISQIVPQIGGHTLMHLLHLRGFTLDTDVPLSNVMGTSLGFMTAAMAGVVEEIVVLGFLVHRLEQRGWNPVAIAAVAVVIRVAYHLYYGWGALPIALWALVTVLLYMRVRRLLPFILCHIVWDCSAVLLMYYRMAWVVMAVAFFFASTQAYKQWSLWSPDGATNDR